MDFEDKTLICVQCNKEFVFTAGEQTFFNERGLNSPPKRCKSCRQQNRQKRSNHSKKMHGGEYRSPAFEDSAPAHQKIRGGKGPGRGRRQEFQKSKHERDYRSPSFREKQIDANSEYRSPGFKEYEGISPEDEYRSPGFKEYEGIKPEEEYRSPGFQEMNSVWKDEKPMFSIVCAVCGKEALVPFLPEEKETPMCQTCYSEHREQMRREKEEASKNEDLKTT